MKDLFTELTTLTDDISFDDNFLFHYTDSDTFIKKIIPSQSLLFNAYKNVNDPFEYKKKSFVLESHQDSADFYTDLNRKITEFLNNEIKIACFCLNYKHIKNNDIVMSRGYSKSRMWEAHAAQHSGVCLVFDKNKFIETISQHSNSNTLCAKKVRYTNDIYLSHLKFDVSKNFSEKEISDSEIFDNYKKYFFIKDSDYEDANEFRIIIHDKSVENILISYKNTLKAVILGDNFNPGDFDAIKKIQRSSEIKFFEYYFHDFIYNLRQVNI